MTHDRDVPDELRIAFLGGVRYASESIVALLEDRAALAHARLGAPQAAAIHGAAAAVAVWLQQELDHQPTPGGQR